jgi:hypothetical protein
MATPTIVPRRKGGSPIALAERDDADAHDATFREGWR